MFNNKSFEEDRITEGIFAPWCMYKEDFLSIGGHDELFAPQSREDSDLFNRFSLNGYELIQSWDALVYHFTSRGSRFNKFAGGVCAFLVVLMSVNVFLVVILRYLFGISFIWMQETYVWMHAYIFMLGAGFTYLNDDHVRIDILYKSASPIYRALVDLIGNINQS